MLGPRLMWKDKQDEKRPKLHCDKGKGAPMVRPHPAKLPTRERKRFKELTKIVAV